MREKKIFFILMFCILLYGYGFATLRLNIYQTDKGPVVDGKLNDSVWEKATFFDNFKMVEPKTGVEPSERTELKILTTKSALYLGIRCFDRDSSKISITTLDYDNKNRASDVIKILLDPFLDRRNAYIFFVNAGGAKTDGLAFGERFSTNWDGIWDAKTTIDGKGWTVEIKIPYKSLSFKPDLKNWGINVERYIPRKMEVIRLNGISKDSFFYDPGNAAYLEIPQNIKQGKGITIKGYATASTYKDVEEYPERKYKIDGGFDVYKNFTPNLMGVFSYNTDFAETEVDERRINTTRFPLFFPEKRDFFLEGSDIFNFGIGTHKNFVPFFSRKIGLYNGEPVPVLFGAKLIGKVGNTNVALLDVQTKEYGNLASKNYFAGRIYQNIFEQSKVGVIFTSGNPVDDSINQMYGFDFIYSTNKFMKNKNFITGFWYTYNKNSVDDGKHYAYGLKIDYPNDLLDISFIYSYYGDSFEPALSFLTRNGVQLARGGFAYQPRPEKGFIGKFVRQFFFEFYVSYYWKLDGSLETFRLFTAPINIRTERGEHIEFNIMPNRDVLDEGFEISEGILIPPGDYNFLRYRLEYSTPSYKMFVFDFSWRFGEYYNGKLDTLELDLDFKLSGKINTSLSAEIAKGRFPDGNFIEAVYRLKLDFYLNPDLGLLNYIQYDDVSKNLGVNMRFIWRISPGNTLYIVYNKNWERRWDPESRFYPLSDKGIIKIQFSIRP